MNALLSFVSRLPAQKVAGYGRVDANVAWHPQAHVEFAVGVQNLSGHQHLEFAPVLQNLGYAPEAYGRSAYSKITWRF